MPGGPERGGRGPRRAGAPWIAVLAATCVSIGLLAAGCAGDPEPVEPAWLPGAGPVLPAPPAPFSGERALDDARWLADHLPRAADGGDAERVRAWIEKALAGVGARTERLGGPAEPIARGSPTAGGAADHADRDRGAAPIVVGTLPGRSDDVLLLVARYDARGDAVRGGRRRLDAASGAAVVLELGRLLAARPRPYTVWLAFVAGGGEAANAVGAAGSPPETPDADAVRFAGAAALADALAARGDLERVRLAVCFDDLARSDLRVARDLRSHRVHRESFWGSARALGLEDVFVPDAPFASPESGHRALLARGVRGVVAIVGADDDPHAVEPEPAAAAPDARADRDPAALTGTRLTELGTVVLDGLDRIALRLSRIDGFATTPLAGRRPAPEAGERSEAAEDVPGEAGGDASTAPRTGATGAGPMEEAREDRDAAGGVPPAAPRAGPGR